MSEPSNGDIAFLVYLAIAIAVGCGWLIFRDRPNGRYLIPEEGVGMSAAFIGLVWPIELIGMIVIVAMLFWHRETKWQK